MIIEVEKNNTIIYSSIMKQNLYSKENESLIKLQINELSRKITKEDFSKYKIILFYIYYTLSFIHLITYNINYAFEKYYF